MKTTLIITSFLLALSAPVAFAAGAGDHDHGSMHGAAYSFGEPGKAAEVTRTIKVGMGDDMKFVFDPPIGSIKRGETIRFEVSNAGKQVHEFSVGDAASQRAHAAMMKKMPDMKHDADPSAVTLEPGKSGSVIWKFSKAPQGDIVFACQKPGHYEAGMVHKAKLK
ncbi:cupredoxin domain-containing protein [Chitinilyticum litopenaei]|uniref:cupredoxin domain-containing protein n=1 Tax=Chitinilyticum litopenaei TaxID=1121276 RepID=UPI000418D02F|nr:cupredoxin family protein [Chitinilyticum litopenaei]